MLAGTGGAAACGTPAGQAKPPPSHAGAEDLAVALLAGVSTAVATTTSSAASAVDRRATGRVAGPVEVACEWTAEDWVPDGGDAVLRLGKGATPFARPTRGGIRVHVASGKDTDSVYVTLSRGGWEVSGYLGSDAVALHPARAVVFGGFLVPTHDATLGVEEASPGRLLLVVAPSPGIRASASALRAACACEDVTVGAAGRFDPVLAVPRAGRAKDGVLRARPGIPLSVEAGGVPVAWLDPPGGDEPVKVLETRGAYTRVAWARVDQVVFGWVPVGDVRTRGAVAAVEYGIRGLPVDGATAEPPLVPNVTRYRCNVDVPLVADVRREVMRVGTVAAGTRLEARDRVEGVVRLVVPPTAPVEALDGVALGIPAAVLGGCKVDR